MNDETFLERQRMAGAGKTPRPVPYTAKDFQLEVLDHLAEMQSVTESLRETVTKELKHRRDESRLLRFDGRTLVAIGAIALSMTTYVLQDARRSTRRDADIESSMARLTALERTEAINTEARIKMEVEMSEMRASQVEMKAAIQAAEKKTAGKKSED